MKRRGALLVALSWTAAVGASAQTQDGAPRELVIYAAGSLRAALTDVGREFEAREPGVKLRFVFGASGLLKDRLLAAAPADQADVFASANLEHPQALAAAGRSEAVRPFARNALCVLAAPTFALGGRTLAQRLLDPALKLGTSTPKADPSGDYAFAMFDRIEASGAGPAGSAAQLKARALQLTGGPTSPPPPADRNVYGVLVAGGQADAFVTYCTNAELARREQPSLQVLPVPDGINVSATYGLTLLRPVSAGAQGFADFLLSAPAQQRLRAFGFSAPSP